MKQALDRRTLIGVAERVDFPEWGVTRMRAKIDTGARTSALHVDEVEELGENRVRFSIVQHKDKRDERVTVEAPVVRRGRVRSSTGRLQERIYVSTRISIGGVVKNVEISLASRKRMIFRMLLGRSALADDFIVDPSRRYVASASDKKKHKKKRRVKRRGKKTKRAGTSKRKVTKKRNVTEKRKTTKAARKKVAARVSAKKTKKKKKTRTKKTKPTVEKKKAKKKKKKKETRTKKTKPTVKKRRPQ